MWLPSIDTDEADRSQWKVWSLRVRGADFSPLPGAGARVVIELISPALI